MINITVKDGLKSVSDYVRQLPAKQIPFATSLAINRTAIKAKQDLEAEIPKAFDRPTKYTQNSLYIKTSNKRDLRARVWVKDDTFKGTPASKYMGPEIFGGRRRHKRFEKALIARGLMGANEYAVPGSACKLDSFGNVSASYITQLLAYLRAFGEQGYKANMDDKGRGRIAKKQGLAYFVARPGGHLHPGIWARYSFAAGSAVKPVIMFVKPPAYTKRYKFEEVANKAVDRYFAAEFAATFDIAMKTARP